MTSYLLERAWVDGAVHDDVLVDVVDGRFARVVRENRPSSGVATPDNGRSPRPAGDSATPTRVPGISLPGLANTHSHAFHRALRGRTQRGTGTFWTWREQMYAVAARLDPDSYRRLARAAYREMVAAGCTSVGEFHYLHHQPDGTPYDDPDAMGAALRQAAAEAGIRLVLLDTCYLSSGFGAPPEGVQVRYSDGTAERWAERVERAGSGPAAIHSVRAVPRDQLHVFRDRSPLHVHLSEQVAENDACLAAYGVTPTRLLHEEGLLGPATTVVHATHLTDDDIELLGRTRTNVCVTPTTERDLADGIGPVRRLHDAGCRISVGSDSHAVVDPWEELRAVELDERLATQRRGHWTAAELLDVGTAHGVLGLDDVGTIAVGKRADLVTLDPTTPRTAGTGADEHTAVFAATASDVVRVMVDGVVVHTPGDAEQIGRELDEAVGALWGTPGRTPGRTPWPAP
ncbi:formimidoylglutamate deiminase [Nocardioides sp.]|uniref:formimidoylglutamate deiminase n=1 Tax=Nocardioides sp. TaxID=35761 RepID=UPI002716367B|nr:formimidoylglutamate deiminase [Nocardioides sp.]MDO9457799.1 formimidoylglutamate deiminase [Nocardioides sp.]